VRELGGDSGELRAVVEVHVTDERLESDGLVEPRTDAPTQGELQRLANSGLSLLGICFWREVVESIMRGGDRGLFITPGAWTPFGTARSTTGSYTIEAFLRVEELVIPPLDPLNYWWRPLTGAANVGPKTSITVSITRKTASF
jgi:hypothetical protein